MVAMLLKDTMCYGDEWEEGCFNSDQFRKSRPSKRDAIKADALRMTKQEKHSPLRLRNQSELALSYSKHLFSSVMRVGRWSTPPSAIYCVCASINAYGLQVSSRTPVV